MAQSQSYRATEPALTRGASRCRGLSKTLLRRTWRDVATEGVACRCRALMGAHPSSISSRFQASRFPMLLTAIRAASCCGRGLDFLCSQLYIVWAETPTSSA